MDLANNATSYDTVVQSFERIARRLLSDYQLDVNGSRYLLLDIEFYYFSRGTFEDVYTHQHEAQLQSGKWYFHGSGIDITIGNGTSRGGILIRAIAPISKSAGVENYNLSKAVHGPLNVKTEISSKFHGAFTEQSNSFHFCDVSGDLNDASMFPPDFFVKTKRIGLNSSRDNLDQKFFDGKFRFVIFPKLGLKDKTQIAKDMQIQFPEMTVEKINIALGSSFLK